MEWGHKQPCACDQAIPIDGMGFLRGVAMHDRELDI